ncbi:MAG: 50S ribosomal protein L25 [Opitutia bacterium UBA7350]|nr:MAG: 50S ribosomal protein L25 [Opitutae bacterium UBA7350]
MNQLKLKVVTREGSGTSSARRLRAEGFIPANVSGQGNARSISVGKLDYRKLSREMGEEASLIELTDDQGESMLTLMQSVEQDPIKGTIHHIDFLEVRRGESFVTRVPIHLKNEDNCLGVKNDGGVIDFKSHDVEIRCRPSKLPEHVVADIESLSVGDALHISDLPEIEGVEYLGNEVQVIVSVQPPTVAAVETTEAVVDPADVPADNIKSESSEADEASEEADAADKE